MELSNVTDLAQKIEKLRYEILHGCQTEDSNVIKDILEKIKELENQIQEIINDTSCKQTCLIELTEKEKDTLSQILIQQAAAVNGDSKSHRVIR